MHKTIKVYILIFSFVFSSNSHATGLPVLDIPNTAQNIISVAINAIKQGYQYVTKQTIVKELLETYKIYKKAEQHYDSIVGNFGYGTIINLLTDKSLNKYAPKEFNETVDIVNGAKNSIWTSFSRLHAAADSFDRGNVPYLKDAVYVDPSIPAAVKYEEIFKKNKTYSVLSETSVNQTNERIDRTQKLIDEIEKAETPNKKSDLGNTLLANLSTSTNEIIRMSALQLKQNTDKEIEVMQRRAEDRKAYVGKWNGEFKSTFWN